GLVAATQLLYRTAGQTHHTTGCVRHQKKTPVDLTGGRPVGQLSHHSHNQTQHNRNQRRGDQQSAEGEPPLEQFMAVSPSDYKGTSRNAADANPVEIGAIERRRTIETGHVRMAKSDKMLDGCVIPSLESASAGSKLLLVVRTKPTCWLARPGS